MEKEIVKVNKIYKIITYRDVASEVLILDGVVVDGGTAFNYMNGWSESRMIVYAKQRGWQVALIKNTTVPLDK